MQTVSHEREVVSGFQHRESGEVKKHEKGNPAQLLLSSIQTRNRDCPINHSEKRYLGQARIIEN
jgi:hypothetical protein